MGSVEGYGIEEVSLRRTLCHQIKETELVVMVVNTFGKCITHSSPSFPGLFSPVPQPSRQGREEV